MKELPTDMQNALGAYMTRERVIIQNDITLCDAKSGILIGFSGLMLLRCLDKLGAFPNSFFTSWNQFLRSFDWFLYILALVLLGRTIFFAWRTVKPRIRHTDDYVFWGSRFFKQPAEEFVDQIRAVPPEDLLGGGLRHIHTLGEICREKYTHFNRAVVAAEFGLLIFLVAEGVRIFSGIT